MGRCKICNVHFELPFAYIFQICYILGPIGADGNECQAFCSTVCAADQMACPGGFDYNGCPLPDTCIYTHGNLLTLPVLLG